MKDKAIKAYKEIFEVLNKHRGVCVIDIDSLKRQSENHLFGLKLKYDYGLKVTPSLVSSTDHMRFGEFKFICQYGEKYGRTISWSDDGRQPEDEILLVISFPTGAYIFSDGNSYPKDYPTELFDMFFSELKEYGPKYVDTKNSALYFTLDNAKDVFNNLDTVLQKYKEVNKVDFKRRQIKKLEQELEKMKANNT